jgi:hypothetical protein
MGMDGCRGALQAGGALFVTNRSSADISCVGATHTRPRPAPPGWNSTDHILGTPHGRLLPEGVQSLGRGGWVGTVFVLDCLRDNKLYNCLHYKISGTGRDKGGNLVSRRS